MVADRNKMRGGRRRGCGREGTHGHARTFPHISRTNTHAHSQTRIHTHRTRCVRRRLRHGGASAARPPATTSTWRARLTRTAFMTGLRQVRGVRGGLGMGGGGGPQHAVCLGYVVGGCVRTRAGLVGCSGSAVQPARQHTNTKKAGGCRHAPAQEPAQTAPCADRRQVCCGEQAGAQGGHGSGGKAASGECAVAVWEAVGGLRCAHTMSTHMHAPLRHVHA